MSYSIQIIGGSIIDEVSYKVATITIIGSFIVLVSTAMSTWYGKPVVFHESPTLHSLLIQIVKTLNSIKLEILYMVSFLIGFMTRLYPELKYAGLPLSCDTLEYISVARDFLQEPKILTTYLWIGWWRNLPPLLTWISGFSAWVGIDPWVFFKIYPPIMVGAMSAIIAAIVYRISDSKLAALISSLVMSFNPYILGQSLQWHRHVLGVLMLLIYIYLCERRSRTLHRALVLAITALSYEPTAVIALLLSIAETVTSRDWRSRSIFALSTSIALLVLLWYIGSPWRPIVTITPVGVYVAGNIEYNPEPALKYTIVCILLLTPSLTVIPLWRRIDWRAKLTITVLFTAFILPTLSVIAPVDQHRWFLMLLTLLTPYTIVGLMKFSKSLLILITLITVILGSAYPFTEYGYKHFIIWPDVSIEPAAGYPWRMTPALTNITDLENVANIIKSSRDLILVSSVLYPQLHLYIRNPINIRVIGQDPTLPVVISYAISRDISRLLVITVVNITKQLEEFRENPSFYNMIMSIYLGKEKFVSIEEIKCEEIYSGSRLSAYIVEIVRNHK